MKRNPILLLTLCHSTLLIYSQNTTNSPTSMFGLGELSTGEGGQYSGLGGAGIALQSYNFLEYSQSGLTYRHRGTTFPDRRRSNGSLQGIYTNRDEQSLAGR